MPGCCRSGRARATPARRVHSGRAFHRWPGSPRRHSSAAQARGVDPDFLLRRDLVSTGYTDDELARLLRRGELSRLRRGAYLPPASALLAGERHRLLVHATLRSLRRPAVVSHPVGGGMFLPRLLSVWGMGLARVHVTRRPPAWTRARPIPAAPMWRRLRDDEVTTVDSVRVTDPVRTLLDLARTNRSTPGGDRTRRRLVPQGGVAGTPGRSAVRHRRYLRQSCGGARRRVRGWPQRERGKSRSRVLFRRLQPPAAHPPVAIQVATGLSRLGSTSPGRNSGWSVNSTGG